jgi:hypothetical protein
MINKVGVMPEVLFDRLEMLASRRLLAVLLVLFLVLFLVVFPLASAQLALYSGGVHMIDMETGYTPAQVYQMIAAYGEQGRSLYILTTLTADLIYPLDYALLFALLIVITYPEAFPGGSMRRLVRYLCLMPFATAAVDLLENAGIVAMLALYPQQVVFLAQAASLFTTLKWSFLILTIVLVLLGFLSLGVSRLKKR